MLTAGAAAALLLCCHLNTACRRGQVEGACITRLQLPVASAVMHGPELLGQREAGRVRTCTSCLRDSTASSSFASCSACIT